MDISNPTILIGVIASSATVTVAVITAISTFLSQYFIGRRLEAMKSDYAIQKTEHDARVAYEFSAKKRLYETCAPYIFQAQIALNDVESRVSGITCLSYAKSDKSQTDALKSEYYSNNTTYRIFRVSCIIEYMRKALSFQDFRLDNDISYRIVILHVYDDLLSYYTEISRAGTAIQMRLVTDAEYKPQGLTKGQCDLITELVGEAHSKVPRSWGDFERLLDEASINPRTLLSLNSFKGMISNFDFNEDRVLWRILIGYYILAQFYREGKRIAFNEVKSQFMRDVRRFLPDGMKLKFDNKAHSDIRASYDYVSGRMEITAKMFGLEGAGYKGGDK